MALPNSRARRWFFRLLALSYLCAFWSLYPQVAGLIGAHGILPAGNLLQAARSEMGPERYWAFPTLAWISAGDTFLRCLCLAGALLSLVVLLGFLTAPLLAALWVLYLSLVVAGQEFLSFQWDALLLETGFLAVLFAVEGRAVWLLRFLLFRLMFSSGAVKLASGDPAWRNLTALRYHYETQPLPTPIAWYFHQMPAAFQAFSAVVMFGIELVAPFLIFGPRRLRVAAAGLLAFLQVLIILTGNYAFFNLLTIALCILLLDDEKPAAPASRWRRALMAAVAAVLFFAGGVELARSFFSLEFLPRPAAQVVGRLAELRMVSSYGLFAVMTTSRPEIVVEGSNDGETWLPYEFRYKPSPLDRPPPIVAPHQPRLDWQMWFAALGNYRANPWFTNFMVRLLEGSPEVLSLLQKNPFPQRPPRYVRASLYDYHFTGFTARRSSGAWWRRTLQGLYFPAASLRAP